MSYVCTKWNEFYMNRTVEMQWNTCVQYNIVDIFIQENMLIIWSLCVSAPGHIFDCREYVWGIDIDIPALLVNELI